MRYVYYPDYWIAATITRHPELTPNDLHITKSPFNSINQEYDCFCNQMKTWMELRTAPEDNNDGWLAWYEQGEADMKAAIKIAYADSDPPLQDY